MIICIKSASPRLKGALKRQPGSYSVVYVDWAVVVVVVDDKIVAFQTKTDLLKNLFACFVMPFLPFLMFLSVHF